jgi:hypothetical protein
MDNVSIKRSKTIVDSRKYRLVLKTIMLMALFFDLVLTYYFFKLNNVAKYTFSVIGNYFDHLYRPFYLFWSVYSGVIIFIVTITILTRSEYKRKKAYLFGVLMSALLIVTGFIPAKSVQMPLLHTLHFTTSILFAVFTYLTFERFLKFYALKYKVSTNLLYSWFYLIFIGSFAFLSTFGRNGLFQIWYFSLFITLLMFLFVKSFSY